MHAYQHESKQRYGPILWIHVGEGNGYNGASIHNQDREHDANVVVLLSGQALPVGHGHGHQ